MRGFIFCCFTGKKSSKTRHGPGSSTKDFSEYCQPISPDAESHKELANSAELDLNNRKQSYDSPKVERRLRKSRTINDNDYHPLANYVFPRTLTS
ncbi:unnamed protein product [Blepharisma stoltei]|uniref:Uncharacterized protein n=1 Tax=Blepharisma stoltei TaxID=1481888 RepID=A0AAU9JEZ4_9CILI|nr:unnamed protein product [Blepharisma stoltei]